jgi:hypothetical protein
MVRAFTSNRRATNRAAARFSPIAAYRVAGAVEPDFLAVDACDKLCCRRICKASTRLALKTGVILIVMVLLICWYSSSYGAAVIL